MAKGQILTRHKDIQAWVARQRGCPAISRVRDDMGEQTSRLKLKFERGGDEEALDGEASPCSWSAWLAELDRQQLALIVEPSGAFKLAPRKTLH